MARIIFVIYANQKKKKIVFNIVILFATISFGAAQFVSVQHEFSSYKLSDVFVNSNYSKINVLNYLNYLCIKTLNEFSEKKTRKLQQITMIGRKQ